jgi:hypothetical protein
MISEVFQTDTNLCEKQALFLLLFISLCTSALKFAIIFLPLELLPLEFFSFLKISLFPITFLAIPY